MLRRSNTDSKATANSGSSNSSSNGSPPVSGFKMLKMLKSYYQKSTSPRCRVQESDGSFFESYTALAWRQENKRLRAASELTPAKAQLRYANLYSTNVRKLVDKEHGLAMLKLDRLKQESCNRLAQPKLTPCTELLCTIGTNLCKKWDLENHTIIILYIRTLAELVKYKLAQPRPRPCTELLSYDRNKPL
ncbi:Bai1-associated protein [Plakobranchus ocellatus]|uniref:Bai1-associated protein n=1 Tax=Plakobranchus ocellatus TaxID=259542 RepID=A0AAV4D1T0_9GAST|nr:Bai1-associated protein [Plakobranchus ocellatus]